MKTVLHLGLLCAVFTLFTFSTSFAQVRLDVDGDSKLRGNLDLAKSDIDGSIFIGRNTGVNDDGTGNLGVFIGSNAGNLNTSGNGNVFVGVNAGKDNTSGQFNTFIGLGSGFLNTDGGSNTMIGYFAGRNKTTGVSNTYLGTSAGQFDTTGIRNTFLGQGADGVQSDLSNAIAIGFNSKVNCSNCAVIGGSGANAVKVGIGTDTPNARLQLTDGTGVTDVSGGYLITGELGGQNIGFDDNEIQARNDSAAANLFLQASGGNTLLNINGGDVGIGTDTPEALLHIKSPITSDSTGLKITQSGNNSLIYHNDLGGLVLRKFSQVDQLVLGSDGNVGVGTDAPAAKFHVTGSVRFDDLPDGTGANLLIDDDGNLVIAPGASNINGRVDQLEAENEALRARLEKMEQLFDDLSSQMETRTTHQSAIITIATLQQNAPNPFTEATNINYFIPEGTKQASLQVMDQNGRIIKTIPIQARGKGQLTLQANLLSAGTYSYSLILDGRVLETKQMVLTH